MPYCPGICLSHQEQSQEVYEIEASMGTGGGHEAGVIKTSSDESLKPFVRMKLGAAGLIRSY